MIVECDAIFVEYALHFMMRTNLKCLKFLMEIENRSVM